MAVQRGAVAAERGDVIREVGPGREEGPPPTAPRRTLGYQPALDGIRGVALLLVLTFHAGESTGGPVPGGFLAVDVFFVMSGFLITTFLLDDHARTGRVVTREFWARRALRLLPALFGTLLLIAAYAVIVQPAAGMHGIRGQILATVFYVDNWWVIAGRGVVYSPLSQAWSLSIEEQWYIAWPFLLTGLLVVTRTARRWMLAAVLGLALVSWLLMAGPAFSGTGPLPTDEWVRAYNGTETRAWELLAGAALAIVMRGRLRIADRRLRIGFEIAAVLSIAYLAWAAVAMHQQDRWVYQYGFLLIVAATLFLLVAAIQPDGPVVRRVFSWRPLVALGLISYGVYLYHYVLFLWISEERTGLDGVALTALRWSVAIAIATASFFLVEKPVRVSVRWTRPKALMAGAACAAILVISLIATTPSDRPGTELDARAGAYQKLAYTAPDGSERVLVAGDSLAFQMTHRLPSPFDIAGMRGGTAAMLGCGLVDAPIVVDGRARPINPCPFRWQTLYRTAVKWFEPSATVLMLGYGEVFDRQVDGRVLVVGTAEHERHLREQLERARRILTRDGAPMLLATVPCVEPPAILDAAAAAVMRDPARYEQVNRIRREFAAEHRDTVRIVDLAALLCPDGDARAEVQGIRPRADGVNLSPAGARMVWRWLAPQVEAARD